VPCATLVLNEGKIDANEIEIHFKNTYLLRPITSLSYTQRVAVYNNLVADTRPSIDAMVSERLPRVSPAEEPLLFSGAKRLCGRPHSLLVVARSVFAESVWVSPFSSFCCSMRVSFTRSCKSVSLFHHGAGGNDEVFPHDEVSLHDGISLRWVQVECATESLAIDQPVWRMVLVPSGASLSLALRPILSSL
jgi:hypothetical protein